MPIKNGYSEKTVSDNIGELIRAGHKKPQAVAIALKKGREAWTKRFPGVPYPHHLHDVHHRAQRVARGENPKKRTKKEAPKRRKNPESIEARELALFAENDGDLYRQRIQTIITNLAKKKVKGTYDKTKALTLWKYAADDAAKRYTGEQEGKRYYNVQGYGIFSVQDRKETASILADYYDDIIDDEAKELKAKAKPRRKNPVRKLDEYVLAISTNQGPVYYASGRAGRTRFDTEKGNAKKFKGREAAEHMKGDLKRFLDLTARIVKG